MKCRQKSLKGILVILVLWVAALGVRQWKEAKEFTEPESLEPAQITDSSRSGSREDPLESNANPSSHQTPQFEMPVGSAIDGFEDWMGRYFNADPDLRDQLIEAGVTLAERRRSELKSLIQEDPQTALALAVPYEFRREFPSEITELLETLVSNFAQYQLLVYCSLPSHAGNGHAESEYERIAKFGGNRYEVYTSGRRFDVATKDLISINGIAIDEVLAMADDPILALSEAERLDRGFDANLAVSVGGNVYGATDEEAVRRLRKILVEDEGSLGPHPGAGLQGLTKRRSGRSEPTDCCRSG